MSLRTTIAGAVIALGMTMGSSALASTIVNLGFAIDESGSVGTADFKLQKEGLANALALIPTNDPNVQYRVGVVSFGSNVATVHAPSVVTSAADITAIQNAVLGRDQIYTGSTQTGSVINTMVNQFQAFGDLADTLTIFNISTDGVPCCQYNAQQLAENAAAAALAAGVNSIGIELIGGHDQTAVDNMLAVAGPNATAFDSPSDLAGINVATTGFVLKIDNFDDYQGAISAKIQKIVDDVDDELSPVPVPAALPLLLGALGMMGAVRLRRRAA